MRNVRVGLFGIGLDAYWPQFDGLEGAARGYVGVVAERLRRPGVEVVNLGSSTRREKALEAGHRFRQEDVDLIFLTSRRMRCRDRAAGRAARARAGDRPQPAAGAGDRLRVVQPDGRPDEDDRRMAGALRRLPGAGDRQRLQARPHRLPSGHRACCDDDPVCWNEVDDWIDAARVAHVLEHNRLGVMGHYYGGMLDIYSDLTQHCATLRRPHRDARGRRARVRFAATSPTGAGRRPRRGRFASVRRAARLRAAGARARRAHVGRPRPARRRTTTSARSRTTTRAPASPRTRTR